MTNPVLTAPNGGFLGFFKRLWYYVSVLLIGGKWSSIELLTRHRKLHVQTMAKRTGDVAVITGGARGIGVEVIKKLLQLDMHVIIGCRKTEAGEEIINKFRQDGITTGFAECLTLDLMSLASVRNFADKVLSKNLPIHVLINNAGIMFTPYNVTADGFESQFQVNYLSHFLLTHHFLPRLITSGTTEKNSRIVNVSSCANYGGKINFSDLQMEKLYSPHMAYMASKLMQVVSSNDFDGRLQTQGAKVRAYSVHPGVVRTDLYENVWWVQACECLLRCFFKTPEQGADGVAYVAVSPEAESQGGQFFANSSVWAPNKLARNTTIQQKLWDVSCQLVGLETTELSLYSPEVRVDMK